MASDTWEPVSTVARRCRCDEKTVRRWVQAGYLQVKRLPAQSGQERILIRVDGDGHPVWTPNAPQAA